MQSPSVASSSHLPQSAYDPRRHVGVHAERVSDVSSTDYPGHYPGEDHTWDLRKFKEKLQVKVQRLSQRSIELDLVGVDASIANAFRRILIAEVPTIAIEHVYVWNNTSVIHDEVLAHRIGLIPLNIDPELQEFRTARECISYSYRRLHVVCERNPKAPKGGTGQYINEYVKSGDLVWEPQGEQRSIFEVDPAPTNKDIVLAKLRPGQEVEMELHAIKGIGKEHAKWSPVATASYRLHPLIILNPAKPIPRQLAHQFAGCFSPGVVEVSADGEISIDERNMRKDSVSREVLRHPEFDGCVELKRIRDWFIFNIESEGPYTPERLFPESIKVMRSKIASIRKAAEALLVGTDEEGASADGDVEMGNA